MSVCGRIPNSLFERSKTGLNGRQKGEDRMFYRSLEGLESSGKYLSSSPKKSLTVKKNKTKHTNYVYVRTNAKWD